MQRESLASAPAGQRSTSDAPQPQTLGLARIGHTNAPRLAPLARGGGVLTWLMKRFFRWEFGREMAPLSVLFPRFPGMVSGHLRLLHAAQTAPDLDPLLVHLVELRTSLLNGCTFCADLHRALAHEQHPDAQGMARRKLAALEHLDDEVFSDAERAALRYTEEVTRNRVASDVVFGELARHFSDRQIVQLTVVNAVINYTNLMALPLGLQNEGFCALVDQRKARS